MLNRHLFTGVKHIRHVNQRFSDRACEFEHRGDAALHVGRTDPVHAITFDASSGISVRGHRVGVATQHEPPIAPQLGASNQIVTYSVDAEMSLTTQVRLKQVDKFTLVVANRCNIDERGRQQK